MNDELKTLMVFGGAAFLLTKAKKKGTQPALPVVPPKGDFVPVTGDPVAGTFSLSASGWEDTNYMGGFVVGAASVAAAWYAWSVFRPKIRRIATPPAA